MNLEEIQAWVEACDRLDTEAERAGDGQLASHYGPTEVIHALLAEVERLQGIVEVAKTSARAHVEYLAACSQVDDPDEDERCGDLWVKWVEASMALKRAVLHS